MEFGPQRLLLEEMARALPRHSNHRAGRSISQKAKPSDHSEGFVYYSKKAKMNQVIRYAAPRMAITTSMGPIIIFTAFQ